MKNLASSILGLVAIGAIAAAPATAWSQAYPAKAVRVIVPHPPGGYTLCATSAGAIQINPALRREPTYDLTKFTAIVHTGTLQQLMLANVLTTRLL